MNAFVWVLLGDLSAVVVWRVTNWQFCSMALVDWSTLCAREAVCSCCLAPWCLVSHFTNHRFLLHQWLYVMSLLAMEGSCAGGRSLCACVPNTRLQLTQVKLPVKFFCWDNVVLQVSRF